MDFINIYRFSKWVGDNNLTISIIYITFAMLASL